MPLKLPGALKNLLPTKQKSAKKKTTKHGDASTNDKDLTTPPTTDVAMSTFQKHPTEPSEMSHQYTAAAFAERFGTSPPSVEVQTQRQISGTSDYKSMTPVSSVSSELSYQHVHPGGGFPEEGLPDLMRSLDIVDPGGLHSTDSFPSYDSGVQEEYPTVIRRRQSPPASSSLEKAARVNPAHGLNQTQCSQASSPPQRPVQPGARDPRTDARAPSSQTCPVLLADLASGRTPVTAPVRSRRAPIDVSNSSHTTPISRREVAEAEAAAAAAVARAEAVSGRMDLLEEVVVEKDMFPEIALETPIGALRKSRKRLCLMLNIEQPQIDTEYSPDYMGLADMLGFESLEIQNFWERNPADTLFMDWARCRDSRLLRPVLRTLLDCLEKLGRQDIVMECRGLIWEDVSDYLAEQSLLQSYTVQRLQKFDCYVNIAEQDLLGVGREILQNLEGVHRLRLCLTLRDVTLGGFEFEEMATMLETRCDSKVLIVLSKSYEDSDACQFLTQFAVTLDPGSRRNKLIPLLVDEDTYIPRVLRCLAMLNYNRDKRLGFLWPRLQHAIRS